MLKWKRRKREKKEKNKLVSKMALPILFSVVVLIASLMALGLMAICTNVGEQLGLPGERQGMFTQFLIIEAFSLLVGIIVSYFCGRMVTKPINQTIEAFKKLAKGDFDTKLTYDKIFDDYQPLQDLAQSFCAMAQELKGTEMLRADFVNNFSHEFKTPIVSINGFAGLLKQGNLSEKEQREYLDIIESESRRLANMATNVLNLTRLENQVILTDVTLYNLSEQLRSCVLLLEDKWAVKNLDLSIDIQEHFLYGNKHLLEQVWLNLLDNAIKFTPPEGKVEISVFEEAGQISVAISNTGSTIPPEKQQAVFRKFYQADNSHASEGNGIGLAVVKRVTELHGGSVMVESRNMRTVFTVVLPKEKNKN